MLRGCALCLLVCACRPPSFGARAVEVGVLPQLATIQGRDGGSSGLVWGRSVWTFGDTVLNLADSAGSNWHHNSYSITLDLAAADGIAGFEERLDPAGAPRYFLAPTASEAAFNADHSGSPCRVSPCGARWAAWPGPPIWDEPRSRAIIFYGLVYAEPGDFNFHGVGQSVALWSDFSADPERPEVAPGAEHPTLLFGQDEPGWGTGAVIDGGMLHVLACSNAEDGLAPPCYLARVDPARVVDRAAWRFWDGSGWSADMAGRRSLFTGGSSSVTVAWNAHLRAWAAIYALPLSSDVVIRTAPAVTGPWSSARLLFTARKDGAAYDSNWHPEYDDGAEIYVTYSRSNGKGWFGAEFVLERVTLP